MVPWELRWNKQLSWQKVPTTRESSGGCYEFQDSLAMPLGWRQELNTKRVAGQDRVVSLAEAWRRLLGSPEVPFSGSDSVIPHLQLQPSLLPVLTVWWNFLSYQYAVSRSCYNAWYIVGNSALTNRMYSERQDSVFLQAPMLKLSSESNSCSWTWHRCS